MIDYVYSGGAACTQCLAPMVELLSGAAGRLYGCRRCRTVDTNAHEPAPRRWAHQRSILRCERRKLARFGRASRARGRRVPKVVTEERVEQTGYIVAPDRCAGGGLREVCQVADGWIVGAWERGDLIPAVLHWLEYGIDEGMLFARAKQAWLHAYRGDGVYFWAAENAPEAVIVAAAMAIGGPDRLRTAWLRLRAMTGG